MKTFRQYLAESKNTYNISMNREKNYWYIDDGKEVLTDADGDTIKFKSREEAEEYIKSLDESCKTIKEAVLPTENEGWGFFGTGLNYHDQNQMKVFWDYTSKLLAEKLKWDPKKVREFLDSRGGRYFADSVIDKGYMSFRNIDKAFQEWQSKDWFNSYK
jgi:hypothetical protein